MDGPPSFTSVVARPDLHLSDRLTDTSYSNEHAPPSVGSIALAQLQPSDPLTDTSYNNDAPPSVGSMAMAQLKLSGQHTDTSYHYEQPPSMPYDKGASQSAADGLSYNAPPPSLTRVAARDESYSGPGLMQFDSYSNNFDDASTIDPDVNLDYLQVEDDNEIRSRGNTSSTHEIAASKEANLTLEMIRLYKVMFGKDGTSSTAVIPMDFASTDKAEMERMVSRIYRETICPMFSADFNKMHQNYLFMISKKFGLALSTGGNLCTSTSQSLQLKFLNGISTPVNTGTHIEGNEQKPFLVALIDGTTGQIVSTGAEAAMEIEIVVLESESSDDVADNWTSEEFNRIVEKWNGLKVLKGNTFVKLDNGIVSVDKVTFTHSRHWLAKRMCRMGARPVDAGFPGRVKEAKTEPFLVIDRRASWNCKQDIPSLSDPLYKLYNISRNGMLNERLRNENIKTVMDLLTFHAINLQRLKETLKVDDNTLKPIIDHANMCKDDKTKRIYLYHDPSDGQKSNGVAFNISGQLVGVIADSHFIPSDKLLDEKRADAQKLIVHSSEHWDEVVAFKDEDSLIKHLQPCNTLNPPSHNNLNVMLPRSFDTHNRTNLTSPKRPASEHAISDLPKRPRYDHPKSSPSTSICCEANKLESKPDDDDISMHLNVNLLDTWKIVCYAVRWISIISKPRKKRTMFCHDNTVMVIAN